MEFLSETSGNEDNDNIENDDNLFIFSNYFHKQDNKLSKGFNTIKSEELNTLLNEFFENEQKKQKKINKLNEFSVQAIIEKDAVDNSLNKSSGAQSVKSNTVSTTSTSDKKKLFLVISNVSIYDFEFLNNENLFLRREVNLRDIEFFSITSDFKKLVLHLNKKDPKGNMGLVYDNSNQIVTCLSSILKENYLVKKNVVVLPKSRELIDRIKRNSDIEEYK